MIHLTNGESTAASLREAGIEGKIESIDDILMDGPLRNALAQPADLLHRAAWLQERLGIPKADYLAAAARRDRLARLAARHEEVVLWSEEDLFCQANLANFLAKAIAAPRVSLAAPAQGPVATLPAERLRALHASRRAVTPALVEAARAFWRALASPDPRALGSLAPSDAWPALAVGVRAHLARFPGVQDGLGAPERALLRLVAEKPRPFEAIFPAARVDAALVAYGFGDSQAHALLRQMALGAHPLVFVDDPRALEDGRSPAVWALTPLGRDVLEGRKDAVEARGVDTWLGGVELKGPRAAWRWDDAEGRLQEGF